MNSTVINCVLLQFSPYELYNLSYYSAILTLNMIAAVIYLICTTAFNPSFLKGFSPCICNRYPEDNFNNISISDCITYMDYKESLSADVVQRPSQFTVNRRFELKGIPFFQLLCYISYWACSTSSKASCIS